MQSRIVPVVLAGGAGTRLWPLSRDGLPKQFLPLFGKTSTYQQTLLRVANSDLFASPVVITGPGFHFIALRQAIEIGIDVSVLIEPTRRDSGPAIAAAASFIRRRQPDAVILTLAADHVVLDVEAFQKTCAAAVSAAEKGHIVTFGIRPSEPKTSYGYILPGDLIGENGVCAVKKFVEKPDAAAAAQYCLEGYLWNSGNFLFRGECLSEELLRYAPTVHRASEAAVEQAKQDLQFWRLSENEFSEAPQISIDYALMEKTERAAVIEGRFPWSDVGSWDALSDVAPTDQTGNVVQGDAFLMDAEKCIVHADRLTAVVGVSDLIVVNTLDATLVLPRNRAQDVRNIVAKLKSAKRVEATSHRQVHRPWGFYDSVDVGERFQVKRIVVFPGGVLSLQKHLHRAEHWIVVRGTAEVTTGDSKKTVHENESIFIPIGTVHRLANHGKINLEIIEVQTGSYLGEDDIVRIEDIYQRA